MRLTTTSSAAAIAVFSLTRVASAQAPEVVPLAPASAAPAPTSVSVGTTGAKAVAIAGTFFGIQGRIGVALGSSKPGKKGRFMLGLELHPTFIPEVTPVSVFVTIGGGSF